jgi:CheY-like chemotaxis protein
MGSAVMATHSQARLLVADTDTDLRQSMAGFMSARGYLVEQTSTSGEAADVLMSLPIDVMIADLGVPDRGGMELLEFARQSAPTTRSIAIGRDLSDRQREGALRLGALRVLAKPLSLLELADAVAVARDCDDGLYGWLHRLTLVDLLQMFHHAGHSLTLTLRGPREGRVVIVGGEVIHAEAGSLVGAPALVSLLGARRGWIESGPADEATSTISMPFDHLVLDSLRLVDEQSHRSTRPPPRSSFFEGSFGEAFAPVATAIAASPAPIEPLAVDSRLSAWLEKHAPGAVAWLCDTATGAVVELTSTGDDAYRKSAARALGLAFDLAARTDPSWSRVELTVGDVAVALIRRGDRVLAMARGPVGEEVLRRFRFEVTQLARWWSMEAPDAS